MAQKVIVAGEIKTYIISLLLPQVAFSGRDAEYYQAWRNAVDRRYSFMSLTPKETLATIVYNRGMEEHLKADRSLWTAYCCASISLGRTKSFLSLLSRNEPTSDNPFSGISSRVEKGSVLLDYLAKYPFSDVEATVKSETRGISWYYFVVHFEREIERNTVNYLQHIIAQLSDTYGEIPFPNSPREAVMIMKEKLGAQ